MGGFDFFDVAGMAISAVCLIPYVGWGVYTLRQRYRYREELPLRIEALTIGALFLFYFVELYLLKWSVGQVPVLHIFAILGLFVSGAALYGPLAVSLASRMMVDMVMPVERSKTREPRYAPAEALERDGDYTGALGEYLVIARVFPKDATVLTRIGEMHMNLEQPREAVRWFERALVCINSPERSLQVMNRVCSIYARQLESPQEAERLLAEYVRKYPDTPHSDSVRARLARFRENGQHPCVSE